jgi:hypothetical protein
MPVNVNQFTISPVKGQADLSINPNTLGAQVYADEAEPLVPGQAVKLVDSAGGVPKVTAIEEDTDDVFGVVLYNVKNASFPALQALEVGAQGNVVYMEADEAIARGAKVMYVVDGHKVATAEIGKTVLGFAYDKATAAGQLIRVYLLTFSGVSDSDFTAAALVADSDFVNVAAGTPATAGGSSPTAAQVDTGITNATGALVTSTNLALTEIQTKLNAVIDALKDAGLMASA